MLVSNSGFISSFIFSLIVIIVPGSAFAQIRQKSQQIPTYPRYSKLDFSQDLNIFEWLYLFNYQKRLKSGLEFKITEEYRSTLQSIASNDRWKDSQKFSFSLTYPVIKNLFLNTDIFSHILFDPLAGFDNDVMFQSGSAKLTYQPNSNISLSPKISSKWQTQLEQSDHGISYGLGGQLNNLVHEKYEHNLSISGERDIFPQRINEDLNIRYNIKRQFHSSTADTLIVFFDRIRRDSFASDAIRASDTASIFIRNLTQSNRGIENHLSYGIDSNTTLYVKNSISATSFKVNNVTEDEVKLNKNDAGFESNHSVNLVLQQPQWFGNIIWSFRSRSRDDLRQSKTDTDPLNTLHPSLGFDTDEVHVNLGLQAGLNVSVNDSIGFYSSVSNFQYETSDTTYPNDHDQLRWRVTLSHAHNFGQTLKLIWRGSAFLNHFVYISSKFSSNNNWERVFQLTPVIIYQPSQHFTFRQSFTVRAKYQTYDFDDSETSNRNTVNRQFVLANNTKYSFTTNTWLELGLYMELAEQGKLFYHLWRQRLALSWRNQEIQLLFRHKVGTNFVIASGGKLFHQIRWNYKLNSEGVLEKFVKDKHTNLGPLLEMSYRPSSRLEVLFLGNIQVVNSSRRETEYINSFDVNLNWFF